MNQVQQLPGEIRFALRQLRKAPGFACTVLLTLALGITATTVIFSLVNAVILQPLPFPDSGRLVSLDTLENINRGNSSHGQGLIPNETSYPNFFDWRSENKSFSSMASYNDGGAILGASGDSPARHLNCLTVSSEFFNTLGVQPELGRGFSRAEELPGAHVVILSHDLWRNSFAADPHILGKSVVLSDVQYTVVGVMPAGFAFPLSNRVFDVWTSIARDSDGPDASALQRGWNQLDIIARLRPGVTLQQASAEMDSIQSGLAARYADDDAHETAVSVTPLLDDIVSDIKTPLRILFVAVACLLLIVCANVAGLMLTRISRRRGELAIRSALGASRVQILRQLLIESVLLSVGGGVIGILSTSVILKLLPAILPANLPRVHQIALSGGVLAFAVGLSVLTGLLFGVLPAWRASQQDPAAALAENGRSSSTSRRQFRLQSILVVAQTAMGLILLVGAGLLIHSFTRTLKVDPGFDPRQMLTFRLGVSPKRYADQRKMALLREILPSLRALPGVQSTTAAFPMPLSEGNISIGFSIQGQTNPPGGEPSARVSLIEPDYFETLRIPLKQGRYFLSTENDAKGQPVIIINDAFARAFFPGQNPIGQHIRSGIGAGDPPPMREVVGVVANVKRESLTEGEKPEYYIPMEQAPIASNPVFGLRVAGDPDTYANTIRAAIAKIDPELPAYRLQSYRDDLARITAQQRFQTLLLSAFATVALLLAGLGLYAVLSYMVAQRTTELGLRIALGAPRGSVLQLMLFRGLRLAGIGVCAGLMGAALLTRFVAGLLYDVKPLDTATFATMTLVLLAVSALSCLIPAWRAATLDPIDTLRNQ
jgi:predicted permease